ncbi:hypothetical protein JUNP479_2858 [Aeromonas jandaei]|nr:hypothetical protein JUNP479_2858 [Aeromonas jandaei]
MDLRLRPYKGKRPRLGKRVYVDACITLVGDINWPEVSWLSTISLGSGTTLPSYIDATR